MPHNIFCKCRLCQVFPKARSPLLQYFPKADKITIRIVKSQLTLIRGGRYYDKNIG